MKKKSRFTQPHRNGGAIPQPREAANLAFAGWANCGRPTRWRVLRKAKVRPVLMVVAHIFRHQPLQMALIQDDHVIQRERTVALRTNVLSSDLRRGVNFSFPYGSTYTLAFSRLLYPEEVLIAYNVSGNPRNDCVIVDSILHPDGNNMRFLYGGAGNVPVQTVPNGAASCASNSRATASHSCLRQTGQGYRSFQLGK